MKRLILIGVSISVVAVIASPALRRRIGAAGREFTARYRDHERAITAAVLDRTAAK